MDSKPRSYKTTNTTKVYIIKYGFHINLLRIFIDKHPKDDAFYVHSKIREGKEKDYNL